MWLLALSGLVSPGLFQTMRKTLTVNDKSSLLTTFLLSICPADLRCTVSLQRSLDTEAHVCTCVALSDWTIHSGASLLK